MKNIIDRNGFHFIIISIAAAFLFIPFLGEVPLFDWDEINFAESAREMIVSGDYLTVQINFEPFWEKPPLFIWMQVLSMKVFGINEFAARFPNAICGIVTLLFLYGAGRKTNNTNFGIIWVMAYAGSLLPFVYFKSGIIDPWFNLFIFSGLYFFILYLHSNNRARGKLILSAVLIGLAVLTKGPAAVLIFLLTVSVYYISNRFRLNLGILDILLYLLVLIFVGGFWFLLQIAYGNFNTVVDFINYQIRLFSTEGAGHGGFLFYHFVILILGVFPASFVALPSFFMADRSDSFKREFRRWMFILFWVVLILFTIVKTKIVHYSSLCYFPLTYFAASTIDRLSTMQIKWKTVLFIALMIFASLYALLVSSVTFIDSFKYFLIDRNMITDVFALECLKASGGWKGFEFIAGLILLIGVVACIVLWNKGQQHKAIWGIFPFTAFFLFITLLLVTPRIERYSQHAAVEFFCSVSNEDVYLKTLGYKSYTHLFYGNLKMHENPLSDDEQWLLTGDIDKTVYFAIKVSKKERYLKDYPELNLLYEKNGFVFCERHPK